MKTLICVSIALLGAAPALAQPIVATAPRGEVESITVSYADLDIATESGWARLDGRLRVAARSVCDVRPEPESLTRERASSRCFRSALAKGREAGREAMAARQSGTLLAAADVITVLRR